MERRFSGVGAPMTAFALLAIVAIVLTLWVARNLRAHGARVRTLGDLAAKSRPVDIDSFRNLIDPAEEDYLRFHLSGSDFRRLQRARMLAAIEYVRCTAHNARLLLESASAVRTASDPEIRQAGISLANSALQLRVYSLLAMLVFGLRVLAPSLPLRGGDIVA